MINRPGSSFEIRCGKEDSQCNKDRSHHQEGSSLPSARRFIKPQFLDLEKIDRPGIRLLLISPLLGDTSAAAHITRIPGIDGGVFSGP